MLQNLKSHFRTTKSLSTTMNDLIKSKFRCGIGTAEQNKNQLLCISIPTKFLVAATNSFWLTEILQNEKAHKNQLKKGVFQVFPVMWEPCSSRKKRLAKRRGVARWGDCLTGEYGLRLLVLGRIWITWICFFSSIVDFSQSIAFSQSSKLAVFPPDMRTWSGISRNFLFSGFVCGKRRTQTMMGGFCGCWARADQIFASKEI